MSNLTTALVVPDHLNPANVSIRMAGTTDNPLFCLADVCQVLGLQAPHMVAQRLDDDETCMVNTRNTVSGIRGNPNLTFITESGLYTVLLTSRVEAAKPFRKWVTSEVLPTIRKHGCYPAPAEKAQPCLPPAWSQRLSESFEKHLRFINKNCPGHWSILTAISTPMMVIEDALLDHLLPLTKRDLPDNSVASYWRRHREALGLEPVETYAPLYLPERGITVQVKVYPPEERGEFERWFAQVYMPNHMPSYLREKFKMIGKLPALSASDNACRRFCDTRANLPQKTLKLIDQAPDRKIKATPALPG